MRKKKTSFSLSGKNFNKWISFRFLFSFFNSISLFSSSFPFFIEIFPKTWLGGVTLYNTIDNGKCKVKSGECERSEYGIYFEKVCARENWGLRGLRKTESFLGYRGGIGTATLVAAINKNSYLNTSNWKKVLK